MFSLHLNFRVDYETDILSLLGIFAPVKLLHEISEESDLTTLLLYNRENDRLVNHQNLAKNG